MFPMREELESNGLKPRTVLTLLGGFTGDDG